MMMSPPPAPWHFAKKSVKMFRKLESVKYNKLFYFFYSIFRNKRRPYILDIFPGPTALLKATRLLNFEIFSMGYGHFQVFGVFSI